MRAHNFAALLAIVALLPIACSSQNGVQTAGATTADSSGTTSIMAARLFCTPPLVRKGNRCVAPPPPPPVPTQTCWDGSIIPTTQQCPVQPPPPPPPPPVQCPDGSTLPAGSTCPLPPPPPPPPAASWVFCTSQGNPCAVVGTANVRYGDPDLGLWTPSKLVTGSIFCDSSVFGDPKPGDANKVCQTDGQVLIAPPPPPPPATQTCPDGSVILATSQCPVPVPPATQTCADGTVIAATDVCPAPPPTLQWVSAPLQDGGFARVKANDSLWNITGPGAGRALVPGEIVAVYFNGWGYEAEGQSSFAILALSDGTSGRALAGDLEGVAPVGTPPGLPAGWWVPGLVVANGTCTDPRQGHEGEPGVTQGGVYRAAMLAGTHSKLAPGVSGQPGTMWEVFATGDRSYAAHTVVAGECLTGQ